MRKLLILVLLLVTKTAPLMSQEYQKKFGVVWKEELELKACPIDPEAGAMVVFDEGISKFVDVEDGYEIEFSRVKRIKIFSESELEQAEIAIPYYVDGYGRTETLKMIQAFSYNLDGDRVVKKGLEKGAIFDEQISKHWRLKKFAIPNVRAGSIIEYRYVLKTPFHYNLPDWEFQSKIPTIHSQYTVATIPFYEYSFITQGVNDFDVYHSELSDEVRKFGNFSDSRAGNVGNGIKFQDMVYTYGMNNVPAFKDETFITSIDDYIMKIDFQLSVVHQLNGSRNNIITTWEELNKSMLKHEDFGKYIKSSSKYARQLLDEEIVLKENAEQNYAILIDYVKKNFSWNGRYSKYALQSSKEFFKTKKGNVAEMNLFLLSLLNEAGYEAFPVILSSREHGKIYKDYPFVHLFDYVVVMVGKDRPFLADATEPQLPFNKIPLRCYNDDGFIIHKSLSGWINIKNTSNSINFSSIKLTPAKNSSKMDIELTKIAYGYSGYLDRVEYKNDKAALANGLQSSLLRIDEVSTTGYKKKGGYYKTKAIGQANTEVYGDILAVQPFVNIVADKSALTQETRKLPVDFQYAQTEKFLVTVNIPAGFEPSALLKDVVLEDDLVKIDLKSTVKGSVVTIVAEYQYKKAVYSPSEYPKLKQHSDHIAKLFNQSLVFKKATP